MTTFQTDGDKSLDISIQRNEDFSRQFALTDSGGTALDLTGATFAWEFKARAGDPNPPLASATITVDDAAGGLLTVEFSGSDFDDVDGDFDIVRLAYDFIGTQDGTTTVLARGHLNLVPGVS